MTKVELSYNDFTIDLDNNKVTFAKRDGVTKYDVSSGRSWKIKSTNKAKDFYDVEYSESVECEDGTFAGTDYYDGRLTFNSDGTYTFYYSMSCCEE